MSRTKKRQSSMRERTKARAKERSGGGGPPYFFTPEGAEFLKLEKGVSHLDILPYTVTDKNHPEGVPVGEMWYRREFKVHFKIGPSEKSVICPTTIGKPCPICNFKNAMKDGDDYDEAEEKALRPKKRELYNVIDLKDDGNEVKLLNMSFHLFGRKLDKEINEREGEENVDGFAELEGGNTLKIRWDQKSLGGNKFLEVDRIDFESRDDYSEDILDKVHNLDNMLKILPFDELEAIFLGVDDENESTEEKEDTKEKEDPTEEKEEAKEERKPRGRRERENKEVADNECPSKDGKFGEDNDTLDECSDCDKWKACAAEYDSISK